MNWTLLLQVAYVLIMLLVILRVLYDTRSSVKALAYILFIVFVPFVGIFFYFSFGINYRKRKMYSRKIVKDETLSNLIKQSIDSYSEKILNSGLTNNNYRNLIKFIHHSKFSPPTANNKVKILINGEEKFPELLSALSKAKTHIHVEYYIYENDFTGKAIAEILIKKAKEGVEVRFLYDDFGSHGLSKNFIKRLEDSGVQTAPFYKIKWYAFANRLNYRNHRKIIVIDGAVGFVGGINISDKYRNDLEVKDNLYWRDTHLEIKGQATSYLQYLFVCDWNFCSVNQLEYNDIYFPLVKESDSLEKEIVQIVASGPDSDQPVILYSLLEAISSAKKRIYITSPYFIPGESLMDALIIAAQGGLDVKILVPGVSDSNLVNTAASSYYSELIKCGAQIYKYDKGFVHAKTMVVDDDLAIVGSANMDYRSFDLNFEVNAILYSRKIAKQLIEAFENDLKVSTKIDAKSWLERPKYLHLWEKMVRLLSPFL